MAIFKRLLKKALTVSAWEEFEELAEVKQLAEVGRGESTERLNMIREDIIFVLQLRLAAESEARTDMYAILRNSLEAINDLENFRDLLRRAATVATLGEFVEVLAVNN